MIKQTLLALSTALLVTAGSAAAEESWYPSKFGKDDESGRSNLMTPDRVKEAADRQKKITEDDVVAFATDILATLAPEEQIVTLREVSVMTGNGFTPSATIKLAIADREVIGTGTGIGPVDAAAQALKSILHRELGPELELSEYGLKAVTGGTDALAHALIQLADAEGNSFRGEAINADVILASVHAMVQAANRAVNSRRKENEAGEAT